MDPTDTEVRRPWGLRLRSLVLLGVPGAIGALALPDASHEVPAPEPGSRVAIVDSLETVVTIKGPESGDSGWDLFIDEEGNLFTAGSHGGLDGDGDGTVDRPADGIDPMFIKSSPNGMVTWVASPTAPGFDAGRSIASDRAGGLYAVGHVKQGGLRIDRDVTLRSSGAWDAYLMRLDAEGRFLWARMTFGDSIESFSDVASDADGNVYVTGMGYRSVGLEGHGPPMEARTDLAMFLASYDADGNARWIRAWPEAPGWRLQEVAVAPNGDIWVAGHHGEAGVDLDGDGRPELAGHPGFNAFLARFDAGGDLTGSWQATALGSGERAGAGVAEIVFAADGDVVIGGPLVGPVDFDGDGRPDARSHEAYPTSGYVARYSPDGDLRWARSHVIDGVWDVATDGRRFALAGFYAGDRDLDQDGTIGEGDRLRDTSGDDDPSSDLLVLILSEDGRLARHINAPGIGSDQARAVAFVPGRSAIWVTGFFKLGADFDGTLRDDQAFIRCDALGDIFWARYGLIETPAERQIVLSAEPREGGDRPRVDLSWTGAVTSEIDVYRDGALLATTTNDGAHFDLLPPDSVGPFEYRVCETGTQRCSNAVSVTF